MLKRMACLLLRSLVLFALITILGCEGDQGPEGTMGLQGPPGETGVTEMNIIAALNVFNNKAYEMVCFTMSVYNAPSIPDVTFNDKNLTLHDESLITEGRLVYTDCMNLERTDSAFTDISYIMLDGSTGQASSKISLPGEFGVIDQSIIIPLGGDIEIEWSASEGADGYWIYGYLEFFYHDTLGVSHTNFHEVDMILTAGDTVITISGSSIFPELTEIQTANSFDGLFLIRAVTGPWLPGGVNNFTGDAFGIFVGTTDPIPIDISLEPEVAKLMLAKDKESLIEYADDFFNRRILGLNRDLIR